MEKLSHEQVLVLRQQLYNEHLQRGDLTPFIWPWDTFPVLYLVIALCINPYLSRLSAKLYNIITLLLVGGHSAYVIVNRRCLTMASGYVIGLSLTWGTLMTAVLLIFHDPRQDFARLEWRPVTDAEVAESVATPAKEQDSSVRQRTRLSAPDQDSGAVSEAVTGPNYQLVWQMPPKSFIHQIDWAIDLVTSFRGPNWNYRIPTLAKINVPPAPTKAIHLSSSLEVSKAAVLEHRYDSMASRAFRIRAICKTVYLYVLVDIVKAITASDAYFLGVANIDAPCEWRVIEIVHALSGLPISVLTRAFRLLLGLWFVLGELSLVFSLSSTLVYSAIPKIVNPRRFTYSPLLDTRFFPELLGNPLSIIPGMGLAGFWGNFWHQMFRYGITEPSKPILRYFQLSSRSGPGRLVQLFVAFGLSGTLHMNASVTCFSVLPSMPLLPLLFFLSQAVGIVLQTATADLMFKTFKLGMPTTVRKVTNVLFVVVWLYFTAPLLCDDFARCGIGIFEPLPVSFVRGIQGKGWWHWSGIKIQPWTGLGGRNPSMFEKGIGVF